MNNLQKSPQDEQLAQFVDALLEGNQPEFSSDQDTATLQALTEKIVQQNQAYPGAPKIDSQKKLAILTEYRSVYSTKKLEKPAKKWFSFGGNRVMQFSAAAGVFLLALLAIFLSQRLGIPATPASATGNAILLPLMAAGVAVVIMAVIWLASKRK